ncbi:MAG: hypothetical protein HY828_13720 [Actinobacteria bacterium]|nr:hypothetical protein [Actinomycetota bacterium]
MSSIRRDAWINAASNIALAVLGVVSGSIISYRFGAEGRGTLGAAQVVGALSAGFGAMGLGDALLYWIASQRRLTRSLVITASGVGTATATALGTGIGILVGTRIGGTSSAAEFTVFCAAVAGTTAFYTIPSGALRGASEFGRWNALRLSATISWIVALVIAASVSDEVPLLLIAAVYSAALLVLGGLALVRVLVTLPTISSGRTGLRPLLAFGLPSAFAWAPLLLNARIDQVALALNSSAGVVGQYAAAAGYCWATVPLGQAIANLTAPRVAAEPDARARGERLRSLSGLGVTVVGVSGLVAWIAAPFAIRLLNGSGFDDAVGIARILLIGATLQGSTFLLEEGARGLGRPRLAMFAEIAGLVVMVTLLVLYSARGATATATASTIGYVTSFMAIVIMVSKASGVSPVRLLTPRGPSALRGARVVAKPAE